MRKYKLFLDLLGTHSTESNQTLASEQWDVPIQLHGSLSLSHHWLPVKLITASLTAARYEESI